MLEIEHSPVSYAISRSPKPSITTEPASRPSCRTFPVSECVPVSGLDICTTCCCDSSEVLTLESLFRLYGDHCIICGVNWKKQHASLGCKGCGGYAMERPCPLCDGKCESIWKRDVLQTRRKDEATWMGRCKLNGNSSVTDDSSSVTDDSSSVTDDSSSVTDDSSSVTDDSSSVPSR